MKSTPLLKMVRYLPVIFIVISFCNYRVCRSGVDDVRAIR